MKKVNILLVEDDPVQAEEVRQMIESSGYYVTGTPDNLTDALGLFYAQQPDLVIVDIYLHGTPDGITFAQRLNENQNTARPVIFLTQNADNQTFEKAKLTAPYNYLLKPFNPLELQYAIELALDKFTSTIVGQVDSSSNLYVKKGASVVKVEPDEIHYVEVEGKYCKICTSKNSFLVQLSLKKLLDRLKGFQFIRVHRNYAINSNKIHQINLKDHQVVLIGETTIPYSSLYREVLIGRFDILR